MVLLALGVGCAAPAVRAAGDNAESDWPDLAELGRIEVITASRRATSVNHTAAAVAVLTGDEIHRLGAGSIPEALRGVAGLSVAQINGSTWGVGARGFSNQFATKLLVLVDGRSVYTPVFGGVFWDTQDAFLDDVDRVEVVLGSGGSLWGANAVNGVINILTKHTRETLGDLAYGGTDDAGRGFAGARHGWQVADGRYARTYLNYRGTRQTRLSTGDPSGDATQFLQGGFRLDGTGARASWTLQGDAYRGWNDFRVTLPTLAAPPTYRVTDTAGDDVSGANLLGRWETTLASGSTLRGQAYLDHVARSGPIFDVRVDTADVELQHSLATSTGHQFDWGLSARHYRIRTADRWIAFSPSARASSLASVFAEDRFALVPDHLALTAGAKLEHSSVSGFEPQPSAKLAWFPAADHTLWIGWARAVRTPAYTEMANRTDAVVFPPGVRDPTLPAALRGLGNPDLAAERLKTFDAGWRWRATVNFNLTLSAFLNDYARLIKVTGAAPYTVGTPTPALVIPLPQDNGMEGRAYGGELTARWQVRENWRLDLGFANNRVTLRATTPDPFGYTGTARGSPRNTASATSTLALAKRWEFVAAARYVDPVVRYQIPAYCEADVRLAWRPNAEWEVALLGQNLLHARHPESKPSLAGPATEVPRSVRMQLTWKP